MLDFTDEETGGNDDINEVYISGHICKGACMPHNATRKKKSQICYWP